MTDVAHRLRFWRSRPMTADFYDKRGVSLRDTLTDASDEIIRLQAALSTAEEDRKAIMEVARKAECIRHWHDAMDDNSGMVVSADAVRDLWGALSALPESLRSEAEGKGAP